MLRNAELITFLREFETLLSSMPWKSVSPVGTRVKQRLDYIFTHYIDINSVTEREIVGFMELIHSHKINNQVRNMIMARLLFELDIMNTYQSEILRVNILENQILRVMR